MQRKAPKNAYFDEKQAQIAVTFIEKCCVHPKGSKTGEPFILEPWEKKELIEPLFGWRDSATGMRKFTTLMLSVPRKNGKTFICSTLGLYVMLVEQAGTVPEVVSLATDEQQARIVFDMAGTIVKRSPILSREAIVLRDRIKPRREPKAFFRPLNRQGGGKHGLSPSAAICDEVAQYQPAIGFKLLESIQTGFAERPNPLMMYISTCGSNYASNLFATYWDYARGVSDGSIDDDKFLPCIYGASPDDDWTDREVWRKANPNLGVSVRMEFLEDQFKKALQVPSLQASFKTYHLNMWVTSDKQWVDLSVWDNGKAEPIVGGDRRCWGGLDLSSASDLTSFALVFEPDDEGVVDVLIWFWVPEETLVNSEFSHFYKAWADSGFVFTPPGAVIDHDFPRQLIKEQADKFDLQSIGIDRWSSAQIVAKLNDQDGITTVGIGMGYASMAPAVNYAERLIYSNQLRHGGHPVLRWCVDNVMIVQDPAGNQKPDKSRSAGKIDGAVAMLLALKNMDDDLVLDSEIWGDIPIFDEKSSEPASLL